MYKFINFDTLITPTIIKVLFWIGIIISAIGGFILGITGLITMFSGYGAGSVFAGFFQIILALITIVLGILVSRIYCELLIVIFKIAEKLTSIDDKLSKNE